ncbi:uncharacterized protein LOC130821009 [Amaranthus tricolor]|uniref:uncharacterized protein LOC130821009 n=1 Tax=Amaranthus tricolor TaxID=29722 RepID=UPI00258C0518|nr:uncharacterized protein LOC130821009 [Amaranthus tricolor]
MSQYDDPENNPHFWPTQPSDFAAPPLNRPESRQSWDGRPYRDQHPDLIQKRSRQRQQLPPPPHRPGLDVHPKSTQPEHAHQWYPTPTTQQPSTPLKHPPPALNSHLGEVSAQTDTQSRTKHPLSHPQVSFDQGAAPPNSRQHLMYPTPNRTKALTWFGAVFCLILWLVIILGGLMVLIIYLVYRPHTPHFEISSASFNTAYLDMGYVLNSDITILANFTNPNEKVVVDFRYVTLQLYFDKHLIANQYIDPFTIFSTESKLANVEFITSQLRLPLGVTQQLIAQVQRNRVTIEVHGYFHARSKFGSLLRYSYWLYGHCQIEMTRPPSGVMLNSHCRTKD